MTPVGGVIKGKGAFSRSKQAILTRIPRCPIHNRRCNGYPPRNRVRRSNWKRCQGERYATVCRERREHRPSYCFSGRRSYDDLPPGKPAYHVLNMQRLTHDFRLTRTARVHFLLKSTPPVEVLIQRPSRAPGSSRISLALRDSLPLAQWTML